MAVVALYIITVVVIVLVGLSTCRHLTATIRHYTEQRQQQIENIGR